MRSVLERRRRGVMGLCIVLQACVSAGCRPYNKEFAAFHGDGEHTLFPRKQVNEYIDRRERAVRESLRTAIERTYIRKSEESPENVGLDVLTLSGGGEWGAYGSGFLAGWSGTGTRPSFDIVTGVSTGALIATFAFLGTPADDEALRKGYLGINDRDIYSVKYELVLPMVLAYSNSLTRTGKLRDLLESIATPDVVSRVGAEHERGRRLFVGAVNMDLGRFMATDLTEIARQHRAGDTTAYPRYIDAVMASAAIPVFFEPIYIDGFQFVDGGVVRNVFMEDLFGDETLLCGSRFCFDKLPIRVYSLINGTVEARGRFVRDRFVSIGIRGLELLQNERMVGNVLRIARIVSDNPEYSKLEYLVHSIPPGTGEGGDETIEDAGVSEHAFDQGFMRKLYAEGLKNGAGAGQTPSKDPRKEGLPWFTNVAKWEESTSRRPSHEARMIEQKRR